MENNTSRLIRKRDDGYRKSYDIEINGKKLEVHETVSDKGDTHNFTVLKMKGTPSEQEENMAVLFVKRLNEKEELVKSVIISNIISLPKTDKPWGTERLLSSFPQYVLKEIRIMAGQRTSLQFHNQKNETLVFVEGKAIIHYKNNMGEMVKLDAEPGIVVEFPAMTHHRIEARTDIRYLEASTPEIPNDTVRIDDDYGRRMEK